MAKFVSRFCAFALVAALLPSTRSLAGSIVLITPTNLGFGEFQYNLLVENFSPEPAQGLILFDAVSTFGLDVTSPITTPSGWGYLPLFDPASDQVTFYSGAPATDLSMGGSLGGFSFVSFVDPSTLTSADFTLDLVGSDTSSDYHTTSYLVPEPAALCLACSGMLCMAFAAAIRSLRSRREHQ